MKLKSYEIRNHGWEHPDYFLGCGSNPHSNHTFTGVGLDAKEAYEDAVQYACDTLPDELDLANRLPTRPRGIRRTDKVPAKAEAHWYVSILLEIE